MAYATLKARLRAMERALEAAAMGGPWELMEIDSVPDAQQRRQIEEAERAGRTLLVFIRRGDTLWVTGSGIRAPWVLPQGDNIDVDNFV